MGYIFANMKGLLSTRANHTLGIKGLDMRTERVEIYSDETNRVVMRHPGRNFPGVLIQGDTLFTLCAMADEACAKAGSNKELDRLRASLLDLLLHYKVVLGEHEIRLPFDDRPRFLDR